MVQDGDTERLRRVKITIFKLHCWEADNNGSDYSDLKNALPVGTILPWTTSTIPDGFFLCDGDPVSRTTMLLCLMLSALTMVQVTDQAPSNLPDLVGKQVVL